MIHSVSHSNQSDH